jgi:DNA-binding response OmpR family regulator
MAVTNGGPQSARHAFALAHHGRLERARAAPYAEGGPIELTPPEYSLLLHLAPDPKRVFAWDEQEHSVSWCGAGVLAGGLGS